MSASGPSRIVRLLARAAPEEWRDAIAGDLEEERRQRVAAGRQAGVTWSLADVMPASFDPGARPVDGWVP